MKIFFQTPDKSASIPSLFKRGRVWVLFVVFLIILISPSTSNAEETFNLRIEGSTETYFEGPVSIDGCTILDSTGKEHVYAKSAVCGVVEAAKKSSFEYSFQDFGFGLFLTSIGADNTPTDFSKSWGFWLNDDSASVGLDAYAPKEGDNILLAYSSYPGIPLRVSILSDVKIGEPTIFKVEKRTGTTDADFVWHGIWENAQSAKLYINDLSLIVPENGIVTAILPNSKNNIWADGDLFIRSARLIFGEAAPTPSPTPVPTPTPTPSPTPSPTPTPELCDRNASAKIALSYLREKQDDDGLIENVTTSIWSTIAFGANEDRGETIKKNNHSLLSSLLKTKPESATDLERLILALRASGQNPRSYLGTDYVQILKTKFHNDQFGETNLLNDDIFGILALLAAGEPTSSNFLNASAETLLKKQNSDGKWENLDLTAAAIQAIKRYQQNGGAINVSDNLIRAKNYLKDHQDEYGGFGSNSATSAWAIQAIVSLGENPQDWKNSEGKDPVAALISYQNTDGGFSWKKGEPSSPFMTAYAIPALLFTPLPVTKNNLVAGSTPAATNSNSATPSPSPIIKILPKNPPVPITKKITKVSQINSHRKDGVVAGESTEMPGKELTSPAPKTTTPTISVPDKNNSGATIGFGLANVGIGATLTRIVRKIRQK